MSQTKAQLLNPLGDLDLSGQLTGVGATFTGNIRAVDGIFSGNVSVAGTLTKEDVTNVDSVGLITARSGINVTGGNVFIGQGGSGANNAELKLQAGAGTGNDIIAFLNQGGTTKGNLTYDTDNNFLLFNVNTSERLRIKSDGTINIVTQNGALEWTASSGSNPFIRSIGSGQQSLEFNTGGNEALRIQSDGKVGINTASPGSPLEVNGGSALDTATFNSHHANGLLINLQRSGTNTGYLGSGKNIADATGGVDDVGLRAQANLIFTTGGGTERLRIDSSGNILGAGGQLRLKAAVGDSNGLKLYQGGSDTSYILNHYSGPLVLGTVNTERLRIGTSGQIGIAGANYGNAGQVLTSGGSGSAISWADAAGGAEYAGISSGAISAGNPVVVRNDGKLEKVKYSWTASLSPNPAGDSNLVQPTSSAMQDYTVAIWARNSDGTFPAGTNPMVSFFYKNSSSGPSYRTSIVTSGTTNMSHQYSSGFNQGDGIGEFDAAWNPDVSNAAGAGRLLLAFNRTSYHGGKPAVQVMRGPYSNGVWTQGSIYDINNTAAQGGISVGWHDTNRWVTVYGQGGNYYGHVVTLTGSTSVSLGSGTTIETGLTQMSYRGSMTDADDNGKHIVFYAAKTTGNRNSWRYSVATVSGTSVSFSTPNWLGDDANPGLAIGDFRPEISFDSDQNRFLVVYYKETATNGGGAVNKVYARNAIISGTSVTWSAETLIDSTQSQPRGYDTQYDTNLKKHIVYQTDGAGPKITYNLVEISGSSAPSVTTSQANIYSGSKDIVHIGIDYDATYGMIITGGRKSNDGNNLAEFITKTATSSSNLTADNFIGLSKGNYTDGQTAKVNTNGSLDENQSSLTIGQKYFVQKDGTLATSKEASAIAYAGQAVSSTNLIVSSNTIPQTTEGILGYWEWGLCENTFKPWCAGNRFMGAYDNDGGSSSCNFCFGKWYCQDCRYGDKNQGFDFTANIPDSSGNNMCLCTGGYCCNGIGTCCCSWNNSCPDGRFGFPSPGLYCYNLEMQWGFCSAMAQGGCMALTTMFAGKKCRNTACDTWYCDVNGYTFNMNHCNFCQKNFEYHNVRMSGKLPVADTSINIISFRMWENGIGAQIRGDGICNLNQLASYGCYGSRVSFTKISNNPGYFYC